jgi:predicted transcriptional regulator
MPERGRRRIRSELKELLLLLVLKHKGPVGRYRLKHMLGMSDHEGIIKLMLADLRDDAYISTSNLGAQLTSKGEAFLVSRLKEYQIVHIKDIDYPFIEAGPFSVGVQLKGKAGAITSGMAQRDAAVRAGAIGATILTSDNGVLGIPTVYRDLSSQQPTLSTQILQSFSLTGGDVLIITSAPSRWRAFEGALAAAKTLV